MEEKVSHSQRSDNKINFKQKYMTRLKSRLVFIKSEWNKLDRILQKMDQIIAEEIAERDCLEVDVYNLFVGVIGKSVLICYWKIGTDWGGIGT